MKTDLNDKQLQAVQTIEGPLLIIAGAGSGKTRTITFRIANLLDRGIPQSKILALTFTNKAAKEMAGRIRQLTGKKLLQMTVSTFHAFGVILLRQIIGTVGYRDNFSIYDQADKMALINEVARELSYAKDAIDVYYLSSLFSTIKTGMTGWDRSNDRHRALYEEYQSHLKAYNALDFDDLIVLPCQILQTDKTLLEQFQDKYRYITVDEFQDTSAAQYRLLHLLGKKHRNICVVGDDDQSIYSWRGANYENLMQFERDFPELKEIKLEQNYRSTKTILLAANGLIQNNRNRKLKKLWTGIDKEHPIEIHYPNNEIEEGRFIADTIKSIHVREKVPFHSFGVLVRTNSLTRGIEEAFLAENIPYTVSGGSSFFERKEVKDIIAYLKVCANPDDDVNLLRIINTPRRGIGKKALLQIRAAAEEKHCSYYSAVSALYHAADSPVPDRVKKNLGDFYYLIEIYRNKLFESKSLAETVQKFVDNIGYWGWLVQEFQDREKIAKFKYRNLTVFIELIDRWEKDPDVLDKSLYAFLNRITLITKDDIDEDNGGKVNVMTIHAAKGLEFPRVFVAGVEDKIIPHNRAIEEDPANIEEERRLFYVAITRAMEKLILTSCATRRYANQFVECSPSPFLEEIPAGLVETFSDRGPIEEEEAKDMFAALKSKFS